MGLTAPGIVTGHLLVAQFDKLNVPRIVPVGIGLLSGLWMGLGLISCVVLYGISLVVYRLCFSPIAHFPGPRLAAATGWYQAYYTIVHYGQWCFKVKELHEKYGPIVRINPWELSINDADFHSTVSSSGPGRRIEAHLGAGFEGTGLAGGSVGFTISHELHRERRKPLEPFFSRRTVDERLEPMITDMALRLSKRLKQKRDTGTVLTPDHIIVAFSTDVASKHVFGETLGLFEDENFSPHWAETISTWIRYCPIGVTFPWAISVFLSLPKSFQALFKPKGLAWSLPAILVDKLLTETPIPSSEPNRYSNHTAPKTPPDLSIPIGRALLLNPSIRPSDKLRDRMISQLSAIILAAASPRLLASGMYYILASPQIESRLRGELAPLLTPHINTHTLPTSSEFEKLPYMKACIKESLRLTMGIVRQLPKKHVDDEIIYKEWVIPKNTPVGFWTFLQHYDEEVFPEPWKFIPERWLGEYDPRMDRNMIPFGRGGRSCLGRNLVHVEIYFLLAAFFGPDSPRMKLYHTDESDVRFARDCFAAFPKLYTKGLRVVLE